jgi:hypothetical protein
MFLPDMPISAAMSYHRVFEVEWVIYKNQNIRTKLKNLPHNGVTSLPYAAKHM